MNDLEANMILCLNCQNLVKNIASDGSHCPRCNQKISSRVKDSLTKSLALTIAALILYIPANLLPVMTAKSMNQGEPSTILAGIIQLFESGMYFIGSIVFVASILIPLFKILAMLYLIFTIKLGGERTKRVKTSLFHVVKFIGKWSMLDIYVIAILVAVVNIEFVAQVKVEQGASYFALVVVLTMVAAKTFDTRLCWDEKES